MGLVLHVRGVWAGAPVSGALSTHLCFGLLFVRFESVASARTSRGTTRFSLADALSHVVDVSERIVRESNSEYCGLAVVHESNCWSPETESVIMDCGVGNVRERFLALAPCVKSPSRADFHSQSRAEADATARQLRKVRLGIRSITFQQYNLFYTHCGQIICSENPAEPSLQYHFYQSVPCSLHGTFSEPVLGKRDGRLRTGVQNAIVYADKEQGTILHEGEVRILATDGSNSLQGGYSPPMQGITSIPKLLGTSKSDTHLWSVRTRTEGRKLEQVPGPEPGGNTDALLPL